MAHPTTVNDTPKPLQPGRPQLLKLHHPKGLTLINIDEDVQASVGTEGPADSDDPTEASLSDSYDADDADAEHRRLAFVLRLRAALILLQTGHAEDSVLEQIVRWDEQPAETGDFYRDAWKAQSLYRLHLLVKTLRRQIRKRDEYHASDAFRGYSPFEGAMTQTRTPPLPLRETSDQTASLIRRVKNV